MKLRFWLLIGFTAGLWVNSSAYSQEFTGQPKNFVNKWDQFMKDPNKASFDVIMGQNVPLSVTMLEEVEDYVIQSLVETKKSASPEVMQLIDYFFELRPSLDTDKIANFFGRDRHPPITKEKKARGRPQKSAAKKTKVSPTAKEVRAFLDVWVSMISEPTYENIKNLMSSSNIGSLAANSSVKKKIKADFSRLQNVAPYSTFFHDFFVTRPELHPDERKKPGYRELSAHFEKTGKILSCKEELSQKPNKSRGK